MDLKSLISRLISTQLVENPYWVHNKLLNYKEVDDFFRYREYADPDLLNKVAYYILTYVENLALSGYILTQDKQYLETMEYYIHKLRDVYHKIIHTEDSKKKYNLIENMLDLCFEVGIDPF